MTRDPRELIAIFAGGALGALARYGLIRLDPPSAGAWPWATFAANVVGAFLLAQVLARTRPHRYARPLLGAGFCGALTTFSTMQLELLEMLDHGRGGLAAAYATASIAAGLAAVTVSTSLAQRRQRV